MNYGQFLNMIPEAALVAVLIILFIADFASSNSQNRKWFNPFASVLMVIPMLATLFCNEPTSVFGEMYITTASIGVIKFILSAGTLIVLIMSKPWVAKQEVQAREGEYYMLIVSTLLGMFMMVSAGHFLMFFLGLEMASVPVACLIAFDKHRNNSAEGAAKFIITAIFSSGIMLFGISLLYGACGTLYFGDIAQKITTSPLTVAGLVFFFSGMGFKLSLVPFHFWTADAYQGAPTPVTAYLSVVSKGAAAFALMAILMKVFETMIVEWKYLLYITIVLSITIANLFAIRQSELKRFMAFSSISQAGYIMLAVVGNNELGVAALSYYVLVYVVANMSVFTVISTVEQNNGGQTEISSYDGLYKTNPKLAFLMTVALFSLAGIPPFAGMFSKFFVFMAAAKEGSTLAYAVVFIALVNTVISLYYYLLIVKAMYIKNESTPLPYFKSDCGTRLSLALCTLGIVIFGVASCLFDWIYNAV